METEDMKPGAYRRGYEKAVADVVRWLQRRAGDFTYPLTADETIVAIEIDGLTEEFKSGRGRDTE